MAKQAKFYIATIMIGNPEGVDRWSAAHPIAAADAVKRPFYKHAAIGNSVRQDSIRT